MSLAQILEQLPAFTVAERQLLMRRMLELEDAGLSAQDESIVQDRLEDHHRNPSSAISLESITKSLNSEFGR